MKVLLPRSWEGGELGALAQAGHNVDDLEPFCLKIEGPATEGEVQQQESCTLN
jgi:hypothetical protein